MSYHDESLETGKNEDAQWEVEEVFAPGAGGPKDVHALFQKTRDQLQRVQGNFEAFKRRSEEERNRTLLYATEAMSLEILPIMDDFERVLAHIDAGQGESKDMFQGIKMVHDRLCKVLAAEGVESFQCKGSPFDPTIHEAVRTQAVDGVEPGHIVEVYEQGYRYRGRLLRAAKVVISPLAKPSIAPAIREPDPTQEEADPVDAPLPSVSEPRLDGDLDPTNVEKSWVIEQDILGDMEASQEDGSPLEDSETFVELPDPELP